VNSVKIKKMFFCLFFSKIFKKEKVEKNKQKKENFGLYRVFMRFFFASCFYAIKKSTKKVLPLRTKIIS